MTAETKSNDKNPENIEKSPGIGPLLREAREKKGLTLDEMAEKTKLRQYLLTALEEEKWEVFPAPLFIKGFIRSYARALGLDEKDILARYETIAAFKELRPRPLSKPVKSRGTPIIILILILIAVAAIIILWRGTGNQSSNRDQAPENRLEEQSEPSGKALPSEPEITEMASIQQLGTEQIEGPAREEAVKEDSPVIPEKVPMSLPEPQDGTRVKPVADVWPDSEEERGGLVLKASILEKTWVRIYIDDKDPKEYIFRPGTKLQWEAVKGFDLLVGNATGIEFEFNQKRYKGLGRSGQVVRLQFPEEFSAYVPEE